MPFTDIAREQKTTNYARSPIIKTVLFSSNPDRLKQFYADKHLNFITYTFSEQVHHISTNAGLVIVDRRFAPQKEKAPNGFFVYNNVEDAHTAWKVDASIGEQEVLVIGNFNIPEASYHQLPSPHEENWISILRHGDIEAAKLFFAELGNWQQEKHGNGPLHYSLTNHGNVFEVYPLRKNTL